MSNKLNSQDYQIKFKQGLEANINATATKNLAVVGEPHYTTDTQTLYLFNGTENKQAGMRFTSTDADPTTTEIPDGGFGIHKNTTSGDVFLATNDGGVIKKVALT
jgi:hypothetical protein